MATYRNSKNFSPDPARESSESSQASPPVAAPSTSRASLASPADVSTSNESSPPKDSPPESTVELGGYRDQLWYPRAWNGMPLRILLRIALRNRFQTTHVPRFFACLLTATLSSALALLQSGLYGRRITRTHLSADPIFILGHWRSGTTLLHELMILDKRFTYPTSYQCCTPLHHLVSQSWLSPMVSKLMPDKRPMDNMRFGVNYPQEDEFAQCCLGNHSPYLSMMFPNRPMIDSQYLNMEGLTPKEIEIWRRGFLRFLQSLAIRDPRQIVLKSPPHTARIRTLLEMFPNAKFIHIVRDPYALFPSTWNLWKRLSEDYGFQFPHFRRLEEYIFEGMERLYATFDRDRSQIPPGHFTQLRYEVFVKDKLHGMEQIYRELNLSDFDAVLPAIETYLDENKGFKKNRFAPLSEELRERIATRWRFYFDQYDYPI